MQKKTVNSELMTTPVFVPGGCSQLLLYAVHFHVLQMKVSNLRVSGKQKVQLTVPRIGVDVYQAATTLVGLSGSEYVVAKLPGRRIRPSLQGWELGGRRTGHRQASSWEV